MCHLLCSVLQPGNIGLTGQVPLGTPYPVLRYEGASGYIMCSAFPCSGVTAIVSTVLIWIIRLSLAKGHHTKSCNFVLTNPK